MRCPQRRNMRNARGAKPTLDQHALHPVNARSSSKRNQRTQKRLPLPRPKTAGASPP
ncbi:hypothetical protein RHMOL_Rhmol01G0015600 [Rhododendron molle]|uniref:Uncharacterized protein n=1 Tax=Rhododendron molle TaxID=49168 RepID=A0ACC0Q085_RHOML|nr:hypothetical protein RHMOL_Rhmol01G0015600 [Rhododendron molle]